MLMDKYTINELFDLSLSAESEAEAFFSILSERFSSNEPASDFFKQMCTDEKAHIANITLLRDSIPGERLEEGAPPKAVALVSNFLRFSAEESLQKVKNLEDAYRLTVNLEFSELNRLHELLIDLLSPNDESRKACFSMIKGHLERLNEFRRSTGSSEDRRSIIPISPEV